MNVRRILFFVMCGFASGLIFTCGTACAASDQISEPTEGAPLTSVTIDPALPGLSLCEKNYDYTVYGENSKPALRQTLSELYLADWPDGPLAGSGQYPQLAAALKEFNAAERQNMLAANDNLRGPALAELEERGDNFYPYYDVRKIIVRRADSLVLSFLATQAQYTGGAHGDYGILGINMDSASGEKLRLSQVMRVDESLSLAVVEKLKETYPPATFFSGMEEKVAKEVAEESIVWCLGPRGITFYFNNYDIAPYASGPLAVTLLYDERPGLFQEKYLKGPAAYAEYLPDYRETAVVLKDGPRGIVDKLAVSNYETNGSISIDLNGKHYEHLAKAADCRFIFLHSGEQHNFLYVDAMNKDRGEREILIYSLAGEAPVFIKSYPAVSLCRPRYETSPGYLEWQLITRPDYFRLNQFTPAETAIVAAKARRDGSIDLE